MAEDRVEQLLKRANELDDMAAAIDDPNVRAQFAAVADTCRKMAAQELRVREFMEAQKPSV